MFHIFMNLPLPFNRLMQPAKPELLAPEWTVEHAVALLRDLGWPAKNLLRQTAKAGGWIEPATMYFAAPARSAEPPVDR